MNKTHTFHTVISLQDYLNSKGTDKKIGFVPTMGALHHGHITLVYEALNLVDIVVVSIFVNPTQFNNPEDLVKYPRTLEADTMLLSQAGEIVIFAPNVTDIYPEDYQELNLELGEIADVMEGRFRPGHFKGVVNVVNRLFEIVKPDFAFFGEKDFQQLAVIKFMVDKLNLNVKIIPCKIYREESGLASSSRNSRLSESELVDAEFIYKSLVLAKELSAKNEVAEVKSIIEESYNDSVLELEYFEIVDPLTLQPLTKWIEGAHACVVAYCGEVRLIDNMCLIETLHVSK